MTLPNFLLIGAQKAGTTALYSFLSQHPEIFMSKNKEPHFFSLGAGKLDYDDPQFEPSKIVSDLGSYEALFARVEGEKVIGEASPSYLYSRRAPIMIRELIPSVKLVTILRNPIDRAYSNFLHCRRSGVEHIKDFRYALAVEEDRIRENWSPLWHYKKQGNYLPQLKRYYKHFSADQLAVYLYDDMRQDTANLLRKIYGYLEVDEKFIPDTSIKYNVSGIPKNVFYRYLYKSAGPLRSRIKFILPDKFRWFVRKRVFDSPALSAEERRYLISYYRNEILELQGLIDRDLSIWLD